MAFKIFFTKRAERNIEDAIDYYEFKKENLGLEFYEDLMGNLNYIIENPFMFPVKVYPFREYPLSTFPFVIIYDIVEDVVIVVSIFNTYKNPGKKPNK